MQLYGRQEKTDWMSEGKYGVFFHYLYTPEEMKNFDAKKLASDINDMGAAWAVITLGQNSGYYCAPNDTYERLTENEKGSKCSPLDLPMQLYNELLPYGIKLMLYLPSHAPSRDNESSIKLGVDQKHDGDWVMNDTVVKNWCEIIRDWSCHYGSKVSGWWFDGFYPWISLDEHYGKYYKEALLAGNPDTIVALNQGVEEKIFPANIYCDYTAGEKEELEVLPESRFVDGSQWHVLSYLGDTWTYANARYDADYIADYIEKVSAKGGAVTIDLHIENDGGLSEVQLETMKQVKAKIRKK